MWFLPLLAACSTAPPSSACEDDASVLVFEDETALTCGQAKIPTRYLRILAGRPLPAGTTATGIDLVKQRFLTDPEATLAWLEDTRKVARDIEISPGLDGAEKRAREVWRTIADEGPVRRSDADLWNILEPALSVYARDDEEKLALTEVDMESWISYASLCHEVQGDGVLSVSIAQRADIYKMIKDRFEQADRAEMVALAAFGPIWPDVRDRWQGADYEKQQAWIQAAPRPPKLDASSLGYLEAVLEGDLTGHAKVLHAQLGPFHFRDGPGYFAQEP